MSEHWYANQIYDCAERCGSIEGAKFHDYYGKSGIANSWPSINYDVTTYEIAFIWGIPDGP